MYLQNLSLPATRWWSSELSCCVDFYVHFRPKNGGSMFLPWWSSVRSHGVTTIHTFNAVIRSNSNSLTTNAPVLPNFYWISAAVSMIFRPINDPYYTFATDTKRETRCSLMNNMALSCGEVNYGLPLILIKILNKGKSKVVLLHPFRILPNKDHSQQLYWNLGD
jgi:hypothetical protein